MSIRKPAWFAWRVFLRLVVGWGARSKGAAVQKTLVGRTAMFGRLGLKVSPLLL
ncbi:hypothetical protein [Acidovorax sp. HMWF018]|uniref:hypothetical protein n=1 Tax=Acidovorax sp. HMWF018 TaxID=2056855 RepID=UPI001304C309|nr:hypothetical protein [Acidovorax sp. HMWF018]